MTTYDALIFDCDGVLLNSEELAQEVEVEHLAAIGLHYERAEYVHRFSGTSEPEFIAALEQDSIDRLGKKLPKAFVEGMMAAIKAAFDDRLEAIEGAADLALAWPVSKAVASSSSVAVLQFKLRTTGLADIFGEHIYSAESVSKAKPDPAIFLHAAEGLGVDPGRCLVVEDSVNGVLAAKRAGMIAVGFVGGGHCADDQGKVLSDTGADFIVVTHHELASHLGLQGDTLA